MTNSFFEQPVLNSPYEYPRRRWELDETGQPTQTIIERRRAPQFTTPIPKPKKRKSSSSDQTAVVQHADAWWLGWIEEVPGVNCQERTHEELRQSLAEALADALDLKPPEA